MDLLVREWRLSFWCCFEGRTTLALIVFVLIKLDQYQNRRWLLNIHFLSTFSNFFPSFHDAIFRRPPLQNNSFIFCLQLHTDHRILIFAAASKNKNPQLINWGIAKKSQLKQKTFSRLLQEETRSRSRFQQSSLSAFCCYAVNLDKSVLLPLPKLICGAFEV